MLFHWELINFSCLSIDVSLVYKFLNVKTYISQTSWQLTSFDFLYHKQVLSCLLKLIVKFFCTLMTLGVKVRMVRMVMKWWKLKPQCCNIITYSRKTISIIANFMYKCMNLECWSFKWMFRSGEIAIRRLSYFSIKVRGPIH